MTQTSEDEINRAAEQVAARLCERFAGDLVAIALFGSAARCPKAPFGDLDFYVILDRAPKDRVERDSLLWRAARPSDPPLRTAFIGKTPAEFDADVTPLMLDLALDAKLLYDPSGYLAARLARLRALIARVGLSRTEGPEGFHWKFARQPAHGWSLDWNGLHERGA